MSPKCSTWVQSQKRQHDLCFQGKSFNITVIQVCLPMTKAKGAEVKWFCEDLQELLELTPKEKPKKDVLFFIGDWNAKVGSQEIPGVTGTPSLRLQSEAGQR